MHKFYITAFQPDGTTLLNESFQSETTASAHEQGMIRLKEVGADESTARIIRSDGSWVYFHP